MTSSASGSTAIVTGISGQDGHYLARDLLALGYRVVGLTSRLDHAVAAAADLACPAFALRDFDYARPGAIADVIAEETPDLVFNLASFATGQGMFDAPVAMARLNGFFVVDILDAIQRSPRGDDIAFVQASSAEMFGDVAAMPQSEATQFRPKSPYGAAKLYAHNMVGIYRRAFGVRASSAILYNHESVRRSPAFVTKKIARGAARISLGLEQMLELGSLAISRDWGYAPEYARAMLIMALAPVPDDYVVATGRLSTIADVVQIAFDHVGLDWAHHVKINPAWVRPIESVGLCGDPARIAAALGWTAHTPLAAIITEMVDHERQVAIAG